MNANTDELGNATLHFYSLLPGLYNLFWRIIKYIFTEGRRKGKWALNFYYKNILWKKSFSDCIIEDLTNN